MATQTGKAPIVHANGADIPAIGFGTWQLEGEVAIRAVAEALRVGYRHIDTAQIYGNEAEVGEGIRTSGVPREDIFLTTKVWTNRFRDGDLQRSAEESLAKLGVSHVDLLLLHWPYEPVPLAETMKALSAVRRDGLARHIGVSNFTSRQIAEAAELADGPLATDQVEYHPYLDQSAVRAALKSRGMALTAYSPIAQGRVATDPAIGAIAQAHGKTPSQVALRWLIQQDGVVAIPRSSKPERIAENIDLFDFTLSGEEMDAISALRRRNIRIGDPSWAPAWD